MNQRVKPSSNFFLQMFFVEKEREAWFARELEVGSQVSVQHLTETVQSYIFRDSDRVTLSVVERIWVETYKSHPCPRPLPNAEHSFRLFRIQLSVGMTVFVNFKYDYASLGSNQKVGSQSLYKDFVTFHF